MRLSRIILSVALCLLFTGWARGQDAHSGLPGGQGSSQSASQRQSCEIACNTAFTQCITRRELPGRGCSEQRSKCISGC
jgi:hypothetical protein